MITTKKPSSPECSPFQEPQTHVTDSAKRKRQREPHIAAELRQANLLADGANEPHLRHAHDGAEHAEAESDHGRDAGWKEGGGGVN